MENVEVRLSKIDKHGVFALRPFKKGEIVLRWDISHQLTAQQVVQLSEEEKHYLTCIEGRYTLLYPPERYVNHSCDPNTCVKDFCDVAIRDIQPGEEITGDYTEDLPPGQEISCQCGSPNCRGIIKKSH